jgi:integrase
LIQVVIEDSNMAMGGSPLQAISQQPQPPKLLDRVRLAVRARHYSHRTEEAYVAWIKRFLFFHRVRHPAEMGEPEINQFLTDLAVNKKVSDSTQNQALSGLLFLYQHVLNQPSGWIDLAVRAKKPERLPVVLTRQEVKAILGFMDGSPKLVAALLYGAGLRLMECLRLRVKDVDFTWRLHQRDVREGAGRVVLPQALARKYPNADREWGWQWVFPAPTRYFDQ